MNHKVNVKIPATWSDLLICTIVSQAKTRPIYHKVDIDSPECYQNDHRSIPIILDGYYSAEIVLSSDTISYRAKIILRVGGKIINEQWIWHSLSQITLHDENWYYCTVGIEWRSMRK